MMYDVGIQFLLHRQLLVLNVNMNVRHGPHVTKVQVEHLIIMDEVALNTLLRVVPVWGNLHEVMALVHSDFL